MTKAELIDRIARSRDLPPDISKKLIGQILGIAFDELASYFARSRVTRSQSPRFTFPHFGTFTKKRRSARRGVNPRTLEPIQIEACNTIDFKVGRELREAMNPAAKPEAAEPKAAKDSKPAAKKTSRKTTSRKKTSRKKTAKKVTKKTTKLGPSSAAVSGPGSRRLTPRDEPELEALLEQSTLFPGEADLPPSPMQRVKGRRRTRSRGTG